MVRSDKNTKHQECITKQSSRSISSQIGSLRIIMCQFELGHVRRSRAGFLGQKRHQRLASMLLRAFLGGT
jgi:hypothetical protein